MIKFALSFGWILLSIQILAQTAVTVEPEIAINSAFQEYSPAFYENGLVFISSNPAVAKEKEADEKTGKSTTSIFLARRGQDGKLQLPTPFAEALTSQYYDGPLTFSARNDEVFFTRNNIRNGKPYPAKDGKVKLKIYSATKKNYQWTNIKELPFNSDEYDTAHPTISVDGKRLYFASNRAEGFGGMDLWVSFRQGETWGKPINLGRSVNTPKNEFFPFIHADETLFFASDGHGGSGGLDLFHTQKTEIGWEKPTNLGESINSDKDDFGLIVDADMKNGYFSSNRIGGKGDDDIYSFSAPKGLLTKEAPKLNVPTIDVTVSSQDIESRQVIPNMNVSYTNMADVNNAAILTDEVGNIIGFKTDVGNEYSLEDAQTHETKVNMGASGAQILKLPAGRYLFRFEHPDFKPKYIVKTIFQGDRMVLAQPEKRVEEKAMAAVNKTALTTNDKKELPSNNKKESPTRTGTGAKPNPPNPAKASSGSSADTKKPANTNSTIPNSSTPNNIPNNPNSSNKIPNSAANDVKNVSDMLKTGNVIRLNNIYYHFNDAQFRPDATATLKILVDLMRKYPEMEIELASHTDSRGTEAYNLQLSRQRAEHLTQYLLAYGIDSQRVKPVGYGESRLKNRCADGVDCAEKEHQQNRRTEVRILKMNPLIQIQTPDTQWVKPAIAKDTVSKLLPKPVVPTKQMAQPAVKKQKMLPPAEPHPVTLPQDSVKTAPKDSAPQLSQMAQMVIDSVSRSQKVGKDSSKMIAPKKVLKQPVKKQKPTPAKSPKSKEVDEFEKVFGTER
jgi:outer membrane protein OmpA-like peptidoglycan-associated protein